MRIISRKTLRLFWEKPEYADAEQPLKAWFREASNADWASPAAIKAAFGNASIVANNRVVFNIGGNKYRLVCQGELSVPGAVRSFCGDSRAI